MLKILETARGNLPKKEVKVKPTAAKPAPPPEAVAEPVVDDTPEPAAAAPAVTPATSAAKTKAVSKKKVGI